MPALALGVLCAGPVRPADSADPFHPTALDEMQSAGPVEPITPIPEPPAADPRVVALGERLFHDVRLSAGGKRSCATCHDINGNGAKRPENAAITDDKPGAMDVSTVFNASLSFRLNWEGKFRSLEAQAEASLDSPHMMGAGVDSAVEKLAADPGMRNAFREAYGRGPDRVSLIDALAVYERSLVTPGSRFDRWLAGDQTALSEQEQLGYRTFKMLGCISCHQGVNLGGNLFQRHGIFRPLASPKPEILRVPGLRNIATTAPYFHDGSAATLGDAVRRMGAAQLNYALSDTEVDAIVAFLDSLTGTYRGRRVGGTP
ncbi:MULTISPECIES: cytochrome c peroxidase [Rhodomicrobium]|uniref:cytochrome-c peroxidase n=1 Tax=Rhodomicrobium TaxID=1068 RepID=UPI001FD9AA85|nr:MULTISPECIES: cytochrome c peroxidase [Rhodomicrobium]